MKIKYEVTEIYYTTLSEEDAEKVRQYDEEHHCGLECAYTELYQSGELPYPDDSADDGDQCCELYVWDD